MVFDRWRKFPVGKKKRISALGFTTGGRDRSFTLKIANIQTVVGSTSPVSALSDLPAAYPALWLIGQAYIVLRQRKGKAV